MNKVGINLSIDVTKIDKSKLFSGKKGTYLDATVFVDLHDLDQYGQSGMITQAVSKDEKAQGVKGAILGNAKVFWKDGGQPVTQQVTPNPQVPPSAMVSAVDFADDIPF